MANIPSQEKRIDRSERERLENRRRTSTVKTHFRRLQAEGRLSFTELGRRVGLSTPAVTERVRRLEEAGIITGYHASVDCTRLGYPITALVRLDLARICAETGFSVPEFFYTNSGGIPKLPSVSWQAVSAGLLRGRLFSDNIGMIARAQNAGAVVRGLRAISDFEFEFQMALMNRKLDVAVETIFLMPKEEYTYLSSRIVKEIARLGGDVSSFVPDCVAKALSRKFS